MWDFQFLYFLTSWIFLLSQNSDTHVHTHTQARTHTHTYAHTSSQSIFSLSRLRMLVSIPVIRSSLLGQSKHSVGCYLITLNPHQVTPSSLISSSLPPLFRSLSFILSDSQMLSFYPAFYFVLFHLFFLLPFLIHSNSINQFYHTLYSLCLSSKLIPHKLHISWPQLSSILFIILASNLS